MARVTRFYDRLDSIPYADGVDNSWICGNDTCASLCAFCETETFSDWNYLGRAFCHIRNKRNHSMDGGIDLNGRLFFYYVTVLSFESCACLLLVRDAVNIWRDNG